MNRRRIILADDEPMVRRVMRLPLEKAGYEVEAVANGQEALERIIAKAPDALVTDIEMPVMSGEELCKTLQAKFPERSFPIWVATSLTAIEHREWSQVIPHLSFLEKPLSVRKLISALDEHFRVCTTCGDEDAKQA